MRDKQKVFFIGGDIHESFSRLVGRVLVKSGIPVDVMLDTTYLPDLLERAAFTHDPEEFDVIVLFNHKGAGFKKAALLPDSVKGRTVIVWSYYVEGTIQNPYEALGFSNFSSLDDVFGAVARILRSRDTEH